MNCHRCGALIRDDVVFLEDTADGWFAVVAEPVVDHVVECRCGVTVHVTSIRPAVVHPGQLKIIQGDAA